MKTFKIFLENAAENLAALRAKSENRKQELMQQIATQRQQKKRRWRIRKYDKQRNRRKRKSKNK